MSYGGTHFLSAVASPVVSTANSMYSLGGGAVQCSIAGSGVCVAVLRIQASLDGTDYAPQPDFVLRSDVGGSASVIVQTPFLLNDAQIKVELVSVIGGGVITAIG